MRMTSADYKPFPVVRQVDCLVSFAVLDQNAKKDTTAVSGNDAGVVGGIRATINDDSEMSGKYTSLEQDFWLLDGTFGILPDDSVVETGWWSSSISGADGAFSSPPWILYTFPAPLSTLGWTLHFDEKTGQYAGRVRITCLDADGVTVLDQWETDVDEPVAALQHYVGDYYGVRFEFLSTSEPLRRVRLCEVDFGLTKYYNRNSLGSVRMIYGADILAESFPSRELVFTFDNSDKQYNLLNPDGVYQYLQDGQVISVKMQIGEETKFLQRISMGDFYFTKADVSKSAIVPEITAHDRVYILDNGVFDAGRDEDTTLSAAIAEVLAGFDIPVRYEDGAGDRAVSMTVPQNTRIREAVRMLAQAAMTCPYIDRDGVLVFADLSVGSADGYITADELYDYTGVSIADRVDGVRLTVQDEYRIGKDGSTGRQVIWYAGDNSEAAAQALFGNACVADSAGQAVADWLLARSRMRKRYAVKNRCDPAVEIGDTLRIDDIFNNRENAVVTGLEIEYDGTLSATTKGVGA